MSNIDQFIQNCCIEANISCKSIIVTVFGDTVSQHGDWIWLSHLISALKPFGYSERLVRTSVFRLVQENWLQTKKEGRCSYYAFTESAHKHYQKAAKRIYASQHSDWDGQWLLAMPTNVGEDKLPTLKKHLNWLGFNSLVSGVFAHPSFDSESLMETLDEMALSDAVIVFTSKTFNAQSELALKNQVQQRWRLDQLEQEYQSFNNHYAPLGSKLEQSENKIDTKQAWLIRTLLIHEYRRILLKDYELPLSMLPSDWQGQKALSTAKAIYLLLANDSISFIRENFNNQLGLFGAEAEDFWQRFK